LCELAGGGEEIKKLAIYMYIIMMMGYNEAFSSGREPIRPKRAEIITSNT